MSSETQATKARLDGSAFRRQLMGDETVDRYLGSVVHELAPQLTVLVDGGLFGEIWQAEGLSPRDRCLVTIAALSALGHLPQLRTYAGVAQGLGITEQELVQAIVQLAYYIGFPAAGNALSIVAEVTR